MPASAKYPGYVTVDAVTRDHFSTLEFGMIHFLLKP